MKNKLNFLVSFIFSVGIANGQSTFQKTYGGIFNDYAYCVSQTLDGGYILGGQTVSYGQASQYYIYLVKLDSNGDTLWTKAIGDPNNSIDVHSVQQTSDSGYVACGMKGNDLFFLKTNATGNVVWHKIYGGSAIETAYSIQETSDGGYIVAGVIEFISGSSTICLIKIDSNGNTTWTTNFDGTVSVYDYAYFVEQTDDGGYILTGSGLIPLVSGGMCLVKTDSAGNIAWSKSFDGINSGYSVQQTADGGYIIVGTSFITDYNICLIKTNSSGDTLWTRTFGGIDMDQAKSVKITDDGGYIIAGQTRSFTTGLTNGYLIKTDSNGDLAWSRSFGGTSYDMLYSAQQTSDGGYIAVGQTNSFGSGMTDIYLIKTDAFGMSGCYEMNAATTLSTSPLQIGAPMYQTSSGSTLTGTILQTGGGGIIQTLCLFSGSPEQLKIPALSLFPNPANSYITIDFKSNEKSSEVIITDIKGQLVYSKSGIETQLLDINTTWFADGIYLVSIQTTDQVKIEKLIIQK